MGSSSIKPEALQKMQQCLVEGLSVRIAGPVVAEDTILRTSFRSLAVELTSSDANGTSLAHGNGVQAMEVDSSEPGGHHQVPDASSNAFQERILASICDDYIFHSRTEANLAPRT